MVAGGDEERTGARQPDDGFLPQGDRRQGRDRSVVDIAGDDHKFDLLCRDEVNQPLHEGALMIKDIGSVKGTAQVPIGGVENAHPGRLTRFPDSADTLAG